jgi:hypothetical protein
MLDGRSGMLARLIVKISPLLIFLAIPQLSFAMSVEEYLAKRVDSTENALQEVLLAGTGNGFMVANVVLSLKNQEQLYCLPKNLNLNSTNYRSIIDKELEKSQHKKDEQIETILLFALMQMFPCK